MTSDPFAHEPARWVGKPCSFDYEGQRLVGVVEGHTFTGRTVKGSIPDYRTTVRGGSGKVLTVSMVESRLSIT